MPKRKKVDAVTGADPKDRSMKSQVLRQNLAKSGIATHKMKKAINTPGMPSLSRKERATAKSILSENREFDRKSTSKRKPYDPRP